MLILPNLEILNVVFCQKFVSVEVDDSSTGGVKVCVMLVIISSGHGVGSIEFNVGDSLWQDDLHIGLLHQHVIKDVVHQPHVEDMLGAGVVKILIAWNIVANDIVGLPASKQREPGSEVQLHCIIHDLHVAGGNVANIVSVVNIATGGGQQGLKVLNTG